MFNTDNKECYKMHIRMIYEGSGGTEDWSNDAENELGINYIF